MNIKIFNQNMASINSYLLIYKKEALLIDPGFNQKEIIEYLNDKEIILKKVILTHGHIDHIYGLQKLLENFTFEIYISKYDKAFLYNEEYNYTKAFGLTFKLPELTIQELDDTSEISIFDTKLKIISTPGHTKGSICIKHQNILFSGDTLFYESVGRTDLFSGNYNELKKSLDKLVKTISNDTTIYPGHGPSGTFKKIKEINPYL